MLSLARNIAKVVGGDIALVEKAATLAKADLVTSMVGEFPELQGVMGYYYAIADGEPEEVAYAIMEHYKPVGPSDYIPTRSTSVILALADKLDTLQQMFAIGIKPTGSKDPYALRRAAIGIIRILLHNSLSLPLAQFIEREDVLNFIAERFKVICKEVGIVGESINTMLINSQYDIYATYKSLQSNNVL